jgi:hypothetical protein
MRLSRYEVAEGERVVGTALKHAKELLRKTAVA